MLTSADVAELIELFGVALEAAIDPDLPRPLSRRFLDAASWFGEAARETSPAASVVKYVTALERMVMTEEKDDIATLVADRASALCALHTMAGDRNDFRKKTKKSYDLRSKLVHGALSPFSHKVLEGVQLCARIGETTLLSALLAINERGLRSDTVTVKNLSEWYDKVVAFEEARRETQ